VRRQRRALTLHTVVGAVTIEVDYGQEASTRRWVCPARQAWGLGPHQKMTPALTERACYTVTATGSYAKAAALCGKWGSLLDDATIHAAVQRVGQRAQAQETARLQQGPEVRPAERKRPGPAALVIMLDGWMVRQRGVDWGWEPTEAPGERVAWHEVKRAVIYRLEQAGRSAGGRGLSADKSVVAYQGEPLEFGRRVQAEADRRGLGSAQAVYVVADGAVWIGNVQEDRFAQALGLLDFSHAADHLWAVAEALYPDQPQRARAWVESLRHQLRHGQEQTVVRRLEPLAARCAARPLPVQEVVERERDYFVSHREHLHYQQMEQRGCPVGSGAVESLCSQLQGRFKRCGQFWTEPGLTRLLSVDICLRNGDWDALWNQN